MYTHLLKSRKWQKFYSVYLVKRKPNLQTLSDTSLWCRGDQCHGQGKIQTTRTLRHHWKYTNTQHINNISLPVVMTPVS